MATLEELAGLGGSTDPTTDDTLKAKVEKAMLIIAKEIEDEDPGVTDHAKRLIANILGATDDQIKTAVRNAWNTFLD